MPENENIIIGRVDRLDETIIIDTLIMDNNSEILLSKNILHCVFKINYAIIGKNAKIIAPRKNDGQNGMQQTQVAVNGSRCMQGRKQGSDGYPGYNGDDGFTSTDIKIFVNISSLKSLKIISEGSNGGNGSNGTNGGKGGAASCSGNCTGGNGGKGGKGGNGGNGATGGDVLVYYKYHTINDTLVKISPNISVLNNGGSGGKAGIGGKGGAGGSSSGRCGVWPYWRRGGGSSGKNGRNGSNGNNGNKGNFDLVYSIWKE